MNKIITSIILLFCSFAFCECSSHSGQRNDSKSLVSCPMCNGSGYYDVMPGDIFAPRGTCGLCNGTGKCTEDVANQMINAMQQTNQYINGDTPFDTPKRSSRSASEIQYELDKAYRNLADMERHYQECTTHTLVVQYPYMIQNQRERIWRLEEELRNATY